MLEARFDLRVMIAGFGACLFLALVFLLKWQYRRHVRPRRRVQRGLQGYVSGHSEEANCEAAVAPAQR